MDIDMRRSGEPSIPGAVADEVAEAYRTALW
jgi:hypothetical protein